MRGVFELFAIRLGGPLQGIDQAVLLLLHGLALGTLLGGDVFLWHLHAHLLGQGLHRLHKLHARVLAQKGDGIAAFAAAKAMEKLFDRADAERGRFFPMKRAQPHEVGPAFFQRYITPNHIDDIDALEQVLEEGGRNRHGSDCLANRPSAGALHELKIKK